MKNRERKQYQHSQSDTSTDTTVIKEIGSTISNSMPMHLKTQRNKKFYKKKKLNDELLETT